MATDVVKQIRRRTRRKFSADEKIRIVLEGLRGEIPITESTLYVRIAGPFPVACSREIKGGGTQRASGAGGR